MEKVEIMDKEKQSNAFLYVAVIIGKWIWLFHLVLVFLLIIFRFFFKVTATQKQIVNVLFALKIMKF